MSLLDRFEFPLNPTKAGWPGHYINVSRCGGLSMSLRQLEYPLEQSGREWNSLPVPGFYPIAI